MTTTGPGMAWIPADEYGRRLPRFTVNLLVRSVDAALPFYRDVLQAKVHYADPDFAALELNGTAFMLHADHTYDHHPLYARLAAEGPRGTGAELRVFGIDPDALEKRARAAGAKVLQHSADFPHGWRDVIVEDRDGYIWAIGVPIGGK
jgi:uncharacterized glyoxalase superfamily protein PhnB